DKRPDRAIESARDVGMRLVMAAKVDPLDQDYYENAIAPLVEDHSSIEFIGEVDERGKDEVLGNAYAYLFPIDWPEPFGLTMIEAMACGTPTIAFKCGSVPEVIGHNASGFVVENMDDAVKAVEQAGSLDRTLCRRDFETRFSAPRMARDYVKLYESMLGA